MTRPATRTPEPRHWLLAALAFACPPATALAAAPPSLALTGLVQHPQTLSLDQLRALPAQHVDADFTTRAGQDHHSWTGVLLWDLAQKAGLQDQPGRRTTLQHVLMVRGQDGYTVAIALGEIDPALAGKPVIVAYRQDPATDLPALRLIVPGDRHAARDVRDVAEIDVR